MANVAINEMAQIFIDLLPLVLAHQYMNQLEPDIRHAVLDNARTLVSFRVGPEEATISAKEFQPRR